MNKLQDKNVMLKYLYYRFRVCLSKFDFKIKYVEVFFNGEINKKGIWREEI